MRRRLAELTDARQISPSVRSLTFRTRDGSAVGHRAGQYLDLVVPTARGIPYRRPYSIASAPDPARPDAFEVAVTRVEGGPTSDALHGLAPGAVVEIEGPRGTFVRRPEDAGHPSLLVAAGTGLAPLRAMLTEELRSPEGAPVALLFGCRTPADVLWADELERWRRDRPRFDLQVTLSRPPAGWAGRAGYVQRHVVELAAALPGARAYVCGLSAMVDAVLRRLSGDGGVAPDALRVETYD